MEDIKNPALQNLLEAFKMSQDLSGRNLIYGNEVKDGISIKGKDDNGADQTFGYPSLRMKHRSLEGNPLALWFTKDRKNARIVMHCEFEADTAVAGAFPLKLSDISMSFRYDNGEKAKANSLSFQYTTTRPQVFTGSAAFTIDEFVFIKEKLAKGEVSFIWRAAIQWFDINNPEVVKDIGDPQKKVEPRSVAVTGEIPVLIEEGNKSTYGSVSDLLCWEHEVIESGGEKNEIWFKDTLQDNAYHFLPQVYWIQADPQTCAPGVIVTMENNGNPDDAAGYRIRLRIPVGPYYHPQAERDLYGIAKNRSQGQLKYCNFLYGGYDSARFEWAEDFGSLSKLGIKSLDDKVVVSTAPDSSFTVGMEAPLDGWRILKEKLTAGSLYIGNVILSAKEGLDGHITDIPIPVKLDLRKLTRVKLRVSVLESEDKKIKFPHRVRLCNEGLYPLTIGGCSLSYFSEKNGAVRDATHALEITSSWPITLEKGQEHIVELTQECIKQLQKKNTFLGITTRQYWTRLVCEPFSVRLQDSDIRRIVDGFEDLATDSPSIWKLGVRANFKWDDFPGAVQMELSLKSKYGETVNEIFDAANPQKEIIMAKNLTALLSTIREQDGKSYTYRARLIFDDHSGEWSPWKDGRGNEDSLFIYSSLFKS